ncbi:MAG: YbjN domain-containing protein [Hyphomicrobiales bacterium]
MDDDIAGALVAFFTEEDWPAVYDANAGHFVIRFQGSQAQWTCLAYPLEEDSQFVFYSIAPVFADAAHRPAVAEFLMRANYGLVLGNFEMDYSDGSIRYKTSIDAAGAELTNDLVRPVVHANVQAMDRYLPGLMLVLADGASPEEAIAVCERPADD